MATTRSSSGVRGTEERVVTVQDTDVDVNDATSNFSAALNCPGANKVSFQVVGSTGTHATHVVTLQGSLDGTNFYNTDKTLSGEGIAAENDPDAIHYRASVTTAEGSAATATIILAAVVA